MVALTVLLAAGGLFAVLANVTPRVSARVFTVAVLLVMSTCLLAAAGLRSDTRWELPALVVAFAVLGGGPVVLLTFELTLKTDVRSGLAHLPASVWIGAAERLVFVLALLLGLGEIAAVVLGVKALGQYTSSNNTESAHRVLGTLVSTAWALACFAVFYLATRR